MADKATPQQRAAIEKQGRVIVSASAGSGKTFVMIQRLADLIERGGDLDNVLAVTFTKKAAAQMKEKLRSELESVLKKCAACGCDLFGVRRSIRKKYPGAYEAIKDKVPAGIVAAFDIRFDTLR